MEHKIRKRRKLPLHVIRSNDVATPEGVIDTVLKICASDGIPMEKDTVIEVWVVRIDGAIPEADFRMRAPLGELRAAMEALRNQTGADGEVSYSIELHPE